MAAETFPSRWWLLLVRGLVAIAFGILTWVWPGLTYMALVLLFGAFALVDGAAAIGAAVRGRRHIRWGWLLLGGIAGVAAGLIVLFRPGIGAVTLLYLIAAWAIVNGVSEIAAAVRLRRLIRGEWLLGLSGALSIAFGIFILVAPMAGALAVALWVGTYAIVVGALLCGLAFRVRRWERGAPTRLPAGGMPRPA